MKKNFIGFLVWSCSFLISLPPSPTRLIDTYAFGLLLIKINKPEISHKLHSEKKQLKNNQFLKYKACKSASWTVMKRLLFMFAIAFCCFVEDSVVLQSTRSSRVPLLKPIHEEKFKTFFSFLQQKRHIYLLICIILKPFTFIRYQRRNLFF